MMIMMNIIITKYKKEVFKKGEEVEKQGSEYNDYLK